MRRALLVLCLAGLVPALLRAEEQSFAFALPETEGRISLGIYESSGKLVRTLFSAAEEKDFQIGLNGLIATWDGKDNAGKALPKGTYHVRGWVVPDSVKAEGVAFHFNDWITDDASPRISGIGAISPLADDRFWIFGFRPGKDSAEDLLWTYGETDGLQLETEVPAKSRFLTASGSDAVLANGGENATWLFTKGEPGRLSKIADFSPAGALSNNDLVLDLGGSELRVLGLPWKEGQELGRLEAPAKGMQLDANAVVVVGWTAEKIWRCRKDNFVEIPVAELPPAFDLSVGPEETLWIAGRSGADVVVRQHTFEGELLREMKVQEDFAEQVQIFANKTSLSFYLLLQSSNWNRQTLRGYRPAPTQAPAKDGETAQVDWEVFFDKTIENSRRFGLKDGKLVPDAGSAKQSDRQKVPLLPDSLTGKKGTIVLSAATLPDGLWLIAEDGLPLRRLSEGAFERVVLAAGEKADILSLYAGDGVVVAEYLLSGLDGLAAIDAGEIELP